jgi:Tol biopolymer transport system component/imidazolonepropionase-like amidohydrolase
MKTRTVLILGLASSLAPALSAQDRRVDLALTEGTNLAFALSPDGRTLALDLLGRIWRLPREGGAAVPLTDELGDARQPAWSPDGRRIAFQSFRDGTWHVWSVAADGADLRQHTIGPFDHREPDWAPDGRSLVFSSDRAGNYDIFRLELSTGRLERLTDDPADDYAPAVSRDGSAIAFASTRRAGNGVWVRREGGALEQWAAVEGQANGPSWSPDGRTIAFNLLGGGGSRLLLAQPGVPPRAVSPPEQDVFPFRAAWISAGELLYPGDGRIIHARASGERIGIVAFEARVAFERRGYRRARHEFDATDPEPARGIVAPAISPDGRAIAFAALGDLWLLADGTVTRLSNGPQVETDPAWSPDGRRIVYAADRSGGVDLWIRDLTTGEERQLTRSLGGDAAWPVWSPDGSRVVFQVQRGLGSEIRLVTVATGELTTLRANLFAPSRASWSPDGRLLAVAALRPNSARFREGRNEILLFSPDGAADRWVVPMADRGIGTRGLDGPVWSPDGRHFAFIVDGVLWVRPVTPAGEPAGPPVRLSDELAGSISWTADSRAILYQAGAGLRKVRVADGVTERIDVPLTWRRRHPSGRVVVHAGRLWDGLADGTRSEVDVVIEGHRIARVVPHDPALHRDSVVDGSRLTVLPGLADAHAHLGAGEAAGRMWLAYGITTVRDPASDPFVMRERREAVESGVRVGPRELATGRLIDGERVYYNFNNGVTAGAQLGRELELAADLRFDLIKTYVRLPDQLQRRIIEFAHGHGIAVSSHELYPAVALGADHVEHVRGTSRRGYSPKVSALSRSYQDVVALLTASGMSLTPTIGIQGGFTALLARDSSILDDPRFLAAYGAAYVESLRRRRGSAGAAAAVAAAAAAAAAQGETVRRVVAGGGRVIAGTDSPIVPYGLSLHTELANFVDGGLTPVQALRTATSMFADAMGLADQLGSIAPGRLADLVLVEGDPLQRIADTRRVRVVIKNGEVFRLEELLAGPVPRAD